jgi:hypothetical protein
MKRLIPLLFVLFPSIVFADALGKLNRASNVLLSTQATSAGMTPGVTYYVQVTNTLQSGATFYVSSGTVKGNFYTDQLSVNGASLGGITTPRAIFAGNSSGASGIGVAAGVLDGNVSIEFLNSNGTTVLGDLQFQAGSPSVIAYNDQSLGNILAVDFNKVYRFYHQADGNKYIGIRSSATIPATITFVLPQADGIAGQALVTDGNKNWSFSTISSGGGASTLAVGTGTAANFTTNVTSPTAAISFLGTQFLATTNGTTSFISLVPTVAYANVSNVFSSSQSFNGTVGISTNAIITATGTLNALKIVANGTYGTTDGTSGGLLVDCTGGGGVSGECAQFYSNASTQAALGGIVNIMQALANNTWNEPGLYVKMASTNGSAANIRLDGPVPQIEWVENDQTSPAGKYEDGVNADIRYIAGRKADNSGFESFVEFARPGTSGGGYINIVSTNTPLRFSDGAGTHYIAFRASSTVASNSTYVWPATAGSANQLVQTDGSNNLFFAPASTIAAAAVGIAQLSATGSASATTFLRGDNTWVAPTGSGDAVLAATQTFSGADTFKSSVTFNGPVLDRSNSAGTLAQVLASSGPGLGTYWKTVSGGSSGFSYTFDAQSARSTDTATACAISGATSLLVDSLLCDDTATEGDIWTTTLTPYNGGTLTAAIYFSMTSATSGNVVNDVYVACVADGASQDIDTKVFAAANSVTTAVPGTAGYLKVATVTLTNNDSCASGNLLAIKVRRNGASGSDTATGDQEIRKVRVYE